MKHLTDRDIQLFLDGALPPETQKTFLLHLRNCSHCRQEWRLYRQLYRAMAALPYPAISPDFAGQTMRRISPEIPSRRKVVRKRFSAAFGMLFIFAGLLGGFLLSTWLLQLQGDFSYSFRGFRFLFQQTGILTGMFRLNVLLVSILGIVFLITLRFEHLFPGIKPTGSRR